MSHFTQKLSVREKIGYSLGDSGANFVFQVLMAYQFFFFTNIMGISPAAAGTLFLIGRFFDAFTDPMMGIIADRTKHKWGRFRPWLIWSAIPFAGIFWMTFTTPDFEPTGRLIYAYVMYFLLMGVYTVNNVPYCALNGVMTGDVNERTSLSSYRFVAVTITQYIVQGLTWPLVAKLGGGDDAKGWSITIGIFAVSTIFLFLFAFLAAKERVQPDPKQQASARQDVKDAFANKPWRILFFATLMIFIMLVVRGGSLTFFMNEYVDHEAMFGFLLNANLVTPADGVFSWWQSVLDTFGLLITTDKSNVPNVAYGLFNLAGMPLTLIGVLLSKPLSERFGKRGVFITCLVLTSFSTVWLLFIAADNIDLMFIQGLTWGAAYGPTIPLLWSMIADSADYSEWKTGRRATGFIFAGVVFALKFGLGVGGFIGGIILQFYGYDATAEITENAILGIRHSATLYPALFILVAAVILLFYPITKELNYRIGDELAARRKERESQA
ncbi:sugar (Glycoside-Pentoside-Hexuronide) transporter subfamily [Verrucomicrobiia bacterium DG1235]|nr:sugar (Glycoside-Pentoside-Hexuronide) transporter subfamily [Verrucomicrobiae bacterium DG1235]